jgi:hypothetical protein
MGWFSTAAALQPGDFLNEVKGIMCCGNNGCGNNGCLWIIILIIILFCCCGNGGRTNGCSCGCGCDNDCGGCC